MRQSGGLVVVCALVLTTILGGQEPAFDAASVKRNTSNGEGPPPIVAIRAGRLVAPFATLRDLLHAAFDVADDQIVGAIPWLDRDHFDIAATIPAGSHVQAVRAMLRQLLAERFGLAVHREQRELPLYVLQAGTQPGPGLRPTVDPCRPVTGPPGAPAPPPPPPPPVSTAPVIPLNLPGGPVRCGSMFFPGHISARSVELDTFAWQLSQQLQRRVVNRTRLAGEFDVDLTFAVDVGPALAGMADAPGVAAAVREQLGLRFDATRELIDVIVVDRATPPTEN